MYALICHHPLSAPSTNTPQASIKQLEEQLQGANLATSECKRESAELAAKAEKLASAHTTALAQHKKEATAFKAELSKRKTQLQALQGRADEVDKELRAAEDAAKQGECVSGRESA
jgi:chromosome segregation ATPase